MISEFILADLHPPAKRATLVVQRPQLSNKAKRYKPQFEQVVNDLVYQYYSKEAS